MKYKTALLFFFFAIFVCLLAMPVAAESNPSPDARMTLVRLTKMPVRIERATAGPEQPTDQRVIQIFGANPVGSSTPAASATPKNAIVATSTSLPASSPTSSDVIAPNGNAKATSDAAASPTLSESDVLPAKGTVTSDPTASSTAPPKVTATRTPTNTQEPTQTSAPTETPSLTPSATLPPEDTSTSTAQPTLTSTSTELPSQTPTDTATSTVTPTFTSTATATVTDIFTSTPTQTSAPQNSAPTRTRSTPTATFAVLLPSTTLTVTLTPNEGSPEIANPTTTPNTASQESVIAAQNGQAGNNAPTPTFTPTTTGAPLESMIVPITAESRQAASWIWYFACGFLLIGLLLAAYLRLVVFRPGTQE